MLDNKYIVGGAIALFFLFKKNNATTTMTTTSPTQLPGPSQDKFFVDGKFQTGFELFSQGYGLVTDETFVRLSDLFAGTIFNSHDGLPVRQTHCNGKLIEWGEWVNPDRFTEIFNCEIALGGDPGVAISSDQIVLALFGGILPSWFPFP